MAQSLSKIYMHIIFHIKNNDVYIRDAEKAELYAYMGAMIKETESLPIIINGTKDHVHILCIMSKNISLSDLVEAVKRNSSRWIKTKSNFYSKFAWQGGYAGYSVSQSKTETVGKYIESQEEHHRTKSFKEENLEFLTEHGIEYNETYLWA